MDSCHIFNFIFGTKKATTELSRCFSNIGEDVASNSRSIRRGQRNQSQSDRQPPKSPLKQLQNKLASFVSKVQGNISEDEESTVPTKLLDSKAELLSVQSGTYKATLVRSSSIDDYEAEQLVKESDNIIVVNPIHDANGYDEQANTVEIFKNPLTRHEDDDHMNGQVIETAPLNKEDKQVNRTDDDDNEQRAKDGEPKNKKDNDKHDEQATFRAQRIVLFEREDNCEDRQANSLTTKVSPDERNDKRSLYVRNLVRSIESGSSLDLDETRRSFEEAGTDTGKGQIANIEDGTLHREQQQSSTSNKRRQLISNAAFTTSPTSKPMTLVKPLPPKAPPKSFRAKCIRHQISLNKPTKLQQLFQDEVFLAKFFGSLEPLERCAAAQVCRKWRDILYSDHKYWKGLINVIDCTQLRREHLVECIVNTLHSAKLKQQQQYKLHDFTLSSTGGLVHEDSFGTAECKKLTPASDTIFGFDQEDVWRIQELCNRFALQKHNHSHLKPQSDTCNGGSQTSSDPQQQQQHQHQQIGCSASKSSSIPSQISSTFSSASLSSILSPLSESSRIETIKEKLYTSIDNRGFNAICLFGATDDDIEDLVCKIPTSSHERITIGRLNNCSITNRGLDRFITSFHMISELELTGCNELTNALDLSGLTGLKRLMITDCIHIADGLAQKLMQILHRLTDLTIQAYHLTDAFIEFLSMNCDTSKLQRLELPNCKEITNQSIIVLAKHFAQLELLSLSGSTKISDDGIEILAEQATNLRSLDLSWCPRVTDASLECIACELSDTLTHLVLDRNVNITDIGLGFLASMNKLTSLQIRWCARLSDAGIECLVGMNSLRHLSLAGLHQITARSLLALVEMNLAELELTNCPAVNDDLVMFLSQKLPNCNIIF